jgi:hypothetical protein
MLKDLQLLGKALTKKIYDTTGVLPEDPVAARRVFVDNVGDIGQPSRVAPATLNGLPGVVNVDLSTGKGIPSTFRRPDMETSNVPTYDRGAGQYIYDGAMRSTPLVTGLTADGKVDRAQSDEYKSIRAQYDKARKELPAAAARDKGLELFAQANPTLAARAEASKYGTFNPLMQSTFGYQTGEAPDQVQRTMMIGGQQYDVDPEAIQYQIDQQRMQDMNPGNPLMQSEMQQQRTANQAAEATNTGMNRPVADRAAEFIEMSKTRFPKQSPVMFPTQALL